MFVAFLSILGNAFTAIDGNLGKKNGFKFSNFAYPHIWGNENFDNGINNKNVIQDTKQDLTEPTDFWHSILNLDWIKNIANLTKDPNLKATPDPKILKKPTPSVNGPQQCQNLDYFWFKKGVWH